MQSTPNGRIVWHNGGTTAYGAFIGTAPDKDVGVDRADQPDQCRLSRRHRRVDARPAAGQPRDRHLATALTRATAGAADAAGPSAPATPAPPPPLAALAGDFESGSFGKATVAGRRRGADRSRSTSARRSGSTLGTAASSPSPWCRRAASPPSPRTSAPAPIGFADFMVDADGQRSQFVFTDFENGPPVTFTRLP